MDGIVENKAAEPDKSVEVAVSEPEVVVSDFVEKEASENLELLAKLKDFETTVGNLRDELTKKTDVITDLEKQKGTFEKEVTHVSSRQVVI
jgi:peptidoglycan hydrolase CwlO-like protein